MPDKTTATAGRLVEIKRLAAALRAHDDLDRRFRLILSVPSVGERTALALLIRMPELGSVTRGQAASLAGLAPFVRRSGKWQGQARIGGGRSRLRRSLFAAASAACISTRTDCVAVHPAIRPPTARLSSSTAEMETINRIRNDMGGRSSGRDLTRAAAQ
jgi:transposase